MNHVIRRSLVLLAGLLLVAATGSDGQDRRPKPLRMDTAAGTGPVFIVPIHGMIDNALARYIDRAIADAEEADAALILFDIDTFGGLVDAADQIRKALLNTDVPTVAFIDRNAASAGALISYAMDRIVMVPGASIGAATVVSGVGGEAAPDKYQSYMRGLMRATAEANDRDPRIAEAMVDETIELDSISPAGQVLTLSAQEALALGVADAVYETHVAVLTEMGLAERTEVMHRATRAEQVLRFLGSPVLHSLFMLMMLGGLYFELQTPGVGFPGLMALIGAALFFAPNYLLGLVESWEIVLFFIGVALLLVEIFVLPGFGVAGILGALLIIGSLLAALIPNIGFQFPSASEFASAISTMAVTLVLLVLLIFSLGRYLPRSSHFNRLVLTTGLSDVAVLGVTDEGQDLTGETGMTLTPLRPSGMAEIKGERVDVITNGEYIPPGAPVQVTRVRGSRIEVRQVKTAPQAAETIRT